MRNGQARSLHFNLQTPLQSASADTFPSRGSHASTIDCGVTAAAATPQSPSVTAPLTQGSQCKVRQLSGAACLPCVRGGGSATKLTSRWGCFFRGARTLCKYIFCGVPTGKCVKNHYMRNGQARSLRGAGKDFALNRNNSCARATPQSPSVTAPLTQGSQGGCGTKAASLLREARVFRFRRHFPVGTPEICVSVGASMRL